MAMIDERLQRVSSGIESLAARLRALGTQVKEAGAKLEQELQLPELKLLQEIVAVQTDLGSLWRQLREMVIEAGLIVNEEQAPTTIGRMRDVVGMISTARAQRAAFSRKRDSALKVLERVWLLGHRERQAFQPLEDCQAIARDLHLAIKKLSAPTLHPEVESLCDGSHPFAVLLGWIERREELDDESWQRFEDVVSEAFGRLLATAVSRGRVEVPVAAEAEHAERSVSTVASASAPHAPNTFSPLAPVIEEHVLPPPATVPAAEDVPIEGEVANVESKPELTPTVEELDPETEATEATDAVSIEPVSEALEPAPLPASPLTPGADLPNVAPEAPVAPEPTADPADPGEGDSRRTEALCKAFWTLLESGRTGLAFHVAKDLELAGDSTEPSPPAWLVRGVALAPHIAASNGDLAVQIQTDLGEFDESVFDRGDQRWKQILRFLLAAACLRPGLIAPNTGVASVLQNLRFQDGLGSLFHFSKTIAGHSNLGTPLSPAILSGIRTRVAWEAAAAELRHEVDAWWSQAEKVTIIYAPATNVWREWIKQGGHIYDLLRPVRNNDASERELVVERVKLFADDAHLKRMVRDTDRRVLKRRLGEDIHAKALVQLMAHTREAIGIARRWLAMQDRNPGIDHQFVQDLAGKVRSGVMKHRDETLAELAVTIDEAADPAVRASALCCKRAVENVVSLFEPESHVDPVEPAVVAVLNRDLLYTGVALDPSLEVSAGQDDDMVASAVIDLVRSGRFDSVEAFDRRSERRDHVATRLILDNLSLAPDLFEQLDARRNREIGDCREALERDLQKARDDIEAAVGLGLLREAERSELVSGADAVAVAEVSDALQFGALHDRLKSIRNEIRNRRESQVAEVEARLSAAKLAPEIFARIKAVIDSGDVLTANEYIDLACKDRPLPNLEAQADPFVTFSQESFAAIERFLEPQDPKRRIGANVLVRDLVAQAKGQVRKDGFNWPVPVGSVRGKHLDQAASMLEAWLTMKQTHQVSGVEVSKVLEGLGMVPVKTHRRGTSRRTWVDVTCELIADRERCPVPYFGSFAGGIYRILCVWDRPAETDLLNEIGDTGRAQPALVFYFGRMTAKQRQELAELCRRRRRTFVVIDDVVMLYLCAERGTRLPTMFRCTLPYTFLEPYAATAGLVPSEMFYGREAERNQIVDVNGSCFIYGGRQLGKTALLRDVERKFHDKDQGKIGLWLDLKTYGIGVDRPIEEVWLQLSREFKRFGVIPQNSPAHASTDKIISHIEEWIAAAPERRILLLLDESDRFLEQDGLEEFVHTARLKGLMDRTSRRFKVVFAGLHNVQRTTRLENNPLAHYGEPICIGPLLENGEWREARKLIEEPFACTGYRFESPDLVTRILSQTNYYPSLIQLYCNQLLRHLHEQRASRGGPPFEITSSDVQDAYRSQDLRRAIRDRFTWTLDLDPRYRLVAFCIALNAIEGPGIAEKGMRVVEIRKLVLSFWVKGFRDVTSEDMFRVLLDEMVGLGVLRQIDANHYGLRSLNVTSLLGTQEEIEAELLSFVDREPPPPFEPSAFRAAFRAGDGQVDSVRRNPLSAAQESELRTRKNGVSVIFGCEAGGLGDVDPFLRLAFGRDYVVPVDAVADVNRFLRDLKRLDGRERNGVTLVLVTASSAWSSAWSVKAVERVAALKSKSSFVRVVFVADAAAAWTLLPELESLSQLGVAAVNVAPWQNSALQQWLDDAGFAGLQEADRKRIADVTGNWPLALGELHRRCNSSFHQWGEVLEGMKSEIERSGRLGDHDVESLFGVQHQEVKDLLADLAEVGEASAEDLDGLSSGPPLPIDRVQRILRWGEALSFVRQVGPDQYRVDDLLGRMLIAERTASA